MWQGGNIMRAITYGRISTDLQSETSVQEQTRRCRQYIEMKGWDFVDSFEDVGTGMNTDREGFKQLMERIEEWDVVVAFKLDRFHRSSANAQAWASELNTIGKNFVALDIDVDTTSAMGMAVFRIITALNQMEVEVTRERTVMGIVAKQNSGKWVGKPPYGYASSYALTTDESQKGVLSINKMEADVVKIIFDQHNSNKSPTEITTFLIENGIRTRNGALNWASTTIKGIIANKDFYEGKYYTTDNEQKKYEWEAIL
jgi:site-specific DNA recombinase